MLTYMAAGIQARATVVPLGSRGTHGHAIYTHLCTHTSLHRHLHVHQYNVYTHTHLHNHLYTQSCTFSCKHTCTRTQDRRYNLLPQGDQAIEILWVPEQLRADHTLLGICVETRQLSQRQIVPSTSPYTSLKCIVLILPICIDTGRGIQVAVCM